MRVPALLMVVAATALSGCVSQRQSTLATAPDHSPSWSKQFVAGSRIARRLDSFGNPATGTQVVVITDQSLVNMPGTTLGDKLSGNPGGY